MKRSMKANDGRYIAVVEYRKNDIRVLRFEEQNALSFAKGYRAYVVINNATGSLVKEAGSVSDKLWDVVAEERRKLRRR